jgi:hypothetical protein
MDRLLILDDAKVIEMLKRPDILEAFPFLRNAASQMVVAAGAKPCCGQKKAGTVYPNFGGIRATLDNMGTADKEKLKALLGTQRIRMWYTNHANQTHKSTF